MVTICVTCWRRAVAGMRDKLVHDYFDTHAARLWQTVQIDLPSLLVTVRQMLEELEEGEPHA